MLLLPDDQTHLNALGLDHNVSLEGGLICVEIKDWPLPEGYNPGETDLLLRLPQGFPDAQPDMFWCDPAVRLAATETYPQAADLFETYLDRTWQRFSRHLPVGSWKAGTDNLESYLALIRKGLERDVGT